MKRECKICNISATTEEAFTAHLSSEIHRQLSLSRLFYLSLSVPTHIQEQISVYNPPASVETGTALIEVKSEYSATAVTQPRVSSTGTGEASVSQQGEGSETSVQPSWDPFHGTKEILRELADTDFIPRELEEGEISSSSDGEYCTALEGEDLSFSETDNRQPHNRAPEPLSFADIAKRNSDTEGKVVYIQDRKPLSTMDPNSNHSRDSQDDMKKDGKSQRPDRERKQRQKRRYDDMKENGSQVKYFDNKESAAPKNGWVTDTIVLERREKDLQKGFNSEAYKKYVEVIPKSERVKGVHPKTPNKRHNVSRRSWDSQVRLWRKMIHLWAGQASEGTSPEESPTKMPCTGVKEEL